MGQYYYVVNLDKREYLHPHRLGNGLKLLEFGTSSCGTMTALALLLADGNGRGGGDMATDKDPKAEWIGRWAGDRIVIAGDYADEGKFVTEDDLARWKSENIGVRVYAKGHENKVPELQAIADEFFTNISDDIRSVMRADEYVATDMGELWGEG
jgi:hypothetical protein